jgi:hypothetical protein
VRDQVAQTKLHTPSCTQQVAQTKLHTPSCTDQAAHSKLHTPSCTQTQRAEKLKLYLYVLTFKLFDRKRGEAKDPEANNSSR